MKKALIIIIVLIAGFFITALFLPTSYTVERRIQINAPVDIAYELVNNLKRNEDWNAWQADDPDMKISYGPIRSGKGAYYKWTGGKHGSGEIRIIESISNEKIVMQLRMGDAEEGQIIFRFEPKDTHTLLIETYHGSSGPSLIGRYFGLVMDKMAGNYMEKSLASIRNIAEKKADERTAELNAKQPVEEMPEAPESPEKAEMTEDR